jgi:hypothetical protein
MVQINFQVVLSCFQACNCGRTTAGKATGWQPDPNCKYKFNALYSSHNTLLVSDCLGAVVASWHCREERYDGGACCLELMCAFVLYLPSSSLCLLSVFFQAGFYPSFLSQWRTETDARSWWFCWGTMLAVMIMTITIWRWLRIVDGVGSCPCCTILSK